MPDLWIAWLVAAVGLVVAELFTGTFILMMLGTGALAAAGAAALGVPPALQVLVFAVVSTLALVAVRPALRRHVNARGGQAIGMEAIEGASGLVLEEVDAHHGLVKLGGEMWRARPYDETQVIPAGEEVRVIEIKGATAMVWRD